MAELQTLISFDELDKVEITCQCGTGIVISALNNAPKLRSECPGCGRSLLAASEAVAGFRELYSKGNEFVSLPKDDSNSVKPTTERSIRFRVREE